MAVRKARNRNCRQEMISMGLWQARWGTRVSVASSSPRVRQEPATTWAGATCGTATTVAVESNGFAANDGVTYREWCRPGRSW